MAKPQPITALLQTATRELQTKGEQPITATSARFDLPRFEERFATIFDQFLTLGDPKLERMKAEARDFCLGMMRGDEPRWLSLLGNTGVGKTFLCRLIFKFFRQYKDGRIDKARTTPEREVRHYGELYQWYECVGWMVNEHRRDWMRNAREYWLVGIDDIGAESARLREMSAGALYDILTTREKKWTIVTANLGVRAIGETLDTRIASRLLRHGARVLDIDTQDFNLRTHDQ